MQFQKILTVSAIFIGFLAMLWFLLAALLNKKLPNMLKPPSPEQQYSFDYVVVGAGTCGSVVAALLAQHSNGTVLLLEAGEQFGLLSKIPLLATFQQQGLNDWGFMSVPQRFSSKGLHVNRQCLPRGKGVGGSAQLNYMVHFDGKPNDFDNWAKELQLKEWSYEKIKPFLASAKNKPEELFTIDKKYSKITEALELARAEFQHTNWNIRRSVYTIKKGLRFSVLQRFLEPALSKYNNLMVMTNIFAKRIELTQHKQVNTLLVSTKSDGKELHFKIKVRRELVLSAGAYQTPQLLLASGIGAESELEQLKIPIQHILADIGKNLHDHLNQPLFVSIDVIGPTLNQRALLDPWSIFNYLTSGTGHLGNFGVVGHLDANETVAPDAATFVYGLTFFGAGAIDETALMSISNFKKENFYALFPRYYNTSQEGFVVISACLQPKSRGTVKISTPNTRKPPLIDPNYLSDGLNFDIKCNIKAVRTAVEVVTSNAFKNLNPHIHWPRLKACAKLGPNEQDFRTNKPSDEYLECIIRHVALSSHHPGGTCALGKVLDEQFRVKGLKKLRVIDASALPTPISGNPNTVLMAMSIKGVTQILKAGKQATQSSPKR